jgi:hypothetical protein
MADAAGSELDGLWRGTYNGQPTALLPDGTYPETIKPFTLRLRDKRGIVTGEFQGADVNGKSSYPVENGRRFGKRACFDVILESGDMRWCVEVNGRNLTGSWSAGPEGGPLLGGAGAGARVFGIKGSKVK